jgi:NTE family protein
MQVSAVKELTQIHHDMLVDALRRIFGEFDEQMLLNVLPRLEWVELSGGDKLFAQGDHDDSLYFVISGRLRASRRGEGASIVLGDIARGETVGELAFFTGEARMATVTAVRDCMLARFNSTVFRELLMAYPLIAMNITRLVIERMQRPALQKSAVKPVTLCVAAVTAGVDAEDFAHRLAPMMDASGKTLVVTARQVGEWLGDKGAAQTPRSDAGRSRGLVRLLEKLEGEHQYVLFVADAGPSEWTRRCLRHCDEVLLVADAREPARLSAVEAECLRAGTDTSLAASTLVLLHSAQVRTPRGTSRWLGDRQVSRHIHVRPELAADWSRLGRMVSGNAVGLVFSGGGARGFAHLGIMKALEEAGIAYDMAGGTSIGAAMALFAAADLPAQEAIAHARKAFKVNPTGDFNVVPLMSLIGGKRLRQVIDSGVGDLMGSDSCIEDTWKNYFCISSNYTLAKECVLTRGPLAKSVRASLSIPGALPPVMIDGELHIDGGTFNNFPTDVMATLGAARIIGVNLLREGGLKYNMDELPGNARLLFDKLRGKRHKLPGLMPLLLNTSIMYSYARQGDSKRLCDLYFAPGVHRYGMLEWAGFDEIVEAGYRYAHNELQTSGSAAKFLSAPAVPQPWHLATMGPSELVAAG